MSCKRWCFTAYSDDPPTYDESTMTYICYQREKCPTTERLHWQGFVAFTQRKRLVSVKKCLGGEPHVSQARGTVLENRSYCSKSQSAVPDTFAEFGEMPNESISKSWSQFKEDLQNPNLNVTSIMDRNFMLACRTPRLLDLKLRFCKPPPQMNVTCIALWGATGTGKSRWVMENFPSTSVYWKDKDEWWDGYECEPVIVFDEFYGDVRLAQILRIMDSYKLKLSIKGGFTWKAARYIIFTSNSHPYTWYTKSFLEHPACKAAFMRRLPESNIFPVSTENPAPKLFDMKDSLHHNRITVIEPDSRIDDSFFLD